MSSRYSVMQGQDTKKPDTWPGSSFINASLADCAVIKTKSVVLDLQLRSRHPAIAAFFQFVCDFLIVFEGLEARAFNS
jgi:hypothetical protein